MCIRDSPSPTSQENVINDQPPKSAPLCHGVDYFWLITTISALLLIKGLLKKPPPYPTPPPSCSLTQHSSQAASDCCILFLPHDSKNLDSISTALWGPSCEESFRGKGASSFPEQQLVTKPIIKPIII